MTKFKPVLCLIVWKYPRLLGRTVRVILVAKNRKPYRYLLKRNMH